MTARRHPFDRFIDQVAARPDEPAVVDGERVTTYRELADSAADLAAELVRVGVGPGDRVAVLVPKSTDAIAGFLACLAVQAAYVPIDLASPPARAARMLAVAEPVALLVAADGRELATAAAGRLDGPAAPQVDLDERRTPGADRPPLAPIGHTDGIAHLLFTSGSTGQPKGVAVTVANVAHFVDWATDHFGIGPGDRISGHAPFHFDLSTFDIYGALTAGASVHLVPPALNLLPHKLAQWIRDQRLTQWFSVPTVLGQLVAADVVARGDFADLRHLLWCGEAIATPVLRQLMERLDGVTITNLYGPTETTIASSWYQVDQAPATDVEPVPIGAAIPGEHLAVCDEHGNEQGRGSKGELTIAGAGVTAGYWRDPERTAAAFPALAADGGPRYRTGDVAYVDEHGRFVVLGRLDNQIKYRGHRIELGEIEAALHALPEVTEAAVVFPDVERPVIAAAVVLADGVETAAVRKAVAELVPAYMVPGRWRAEAALPLNGNGKVDRGAVRTRFEQEAGDR